MNVCFLINTRHHGDLCVRRSDRTVTVAGRETSGFPSTLRPSRALHDRGLPSFSQQADGCETAPRRQKSSTSVANMRLEFEAGMHRLLWYRALVHSRPRSESKLGCWKRIPGSAVLPQSHFAYLSRASAQRGRWPRNGRHERRNGTVERRKARLEENRHADIWISHSVSVGLLNWTTIKMAFCTQANTTDSSQL